MSNAVDNRRLPELIDEDNPPDDTGIPALVHDPDDDDLPELEHEPGAEETKTGCLCDFEWLRCLLAGVHGVKQRVVAIAM